MRKSWLPYLLLPLAILIGYFIAKDAEAPSENTSESPPPRKNRPLTPSRHPHRSLRIRTLIDQLEGGTYEDWETFATSIRQEDIPACLDELLARSGPSGLPSELRVYFREFLGKWAETDFEAAHAWAESIPSEQAKTELLTIVLSKHAASDFEETIAIVRSLTNRLGHKLALGDEFLNAAANIGAEAFVEAVFVTR